MEKRFTLFVTLSALVLLVHFWLQPPPKPRPVANKNAIAKPVDDKAVEAEKPDGPANPPPKIEGDLTKDDPESTEKAPARRLTNAAPRWLTLGSVDPTSGHRFLVTFNARGAAVERVEFSSERYRDLEDTHGYLGHLALTPAGNGQGVVVNAVGAGTPAAKAKFDEQKSSLGLQVGDTIVDINGEAVARPSDVQRRLAKTKPGDKVNLTIQRAGAQMVYTAILGRRPLELIRPESEAPHVGPLPLKVINEDLPSFLFALDNLGAGRKSANIPPGEREIPKLTSLQDSAWEVSKSTDDMVEFRFVLDDAELKKIGQQGELEIFKRYRLASHAAIEGKQAAKDANPKAGELRDYHVQLEIEIRSNSAQPHQVGYRLEGPNGLPLEGWWYANKINKGWGGAGARDLVWRTENRIGHQILGCPAIIDNAKKHPEAPNSPLLPGTDPTVESRTVRYIGVDTQYFVAAVLPEDGKESQTSSTRVFDRALATPVGSAQNVAKGREKTLNVSFRLDSVPQMVSEDKPLVQKFTLFLGPKEPAVLDNYGLRDTIELGWWWFVCIPMSYLLHMFYGLVTSAGFQSYGIAILMLTLVVRSCMLPISFKMTKNAQKMQALAPEIKKITEKYKDDLEKRGKAQQELFAKNGVNMYSGCILVFFQLPVFAGLYRLLAVDINLRQAPLVPGWEWCSNLAGPDQYWLWANAAPSFIADETGYFGPFLNILPLVTVALFMMNQKLLTPPPTDEQAEIQQKVMSIMMIFMAAMFFKVPSGLCIYFIASSIWTLAEHKALRKDKLFPAANTSPTPAPAVDSKKKDAALERREAQEEAKKVKTGAS